MKTVHKPWGKEEWLELNEFYCYKRIYINKGYKTSFQYHEEKIETNYIIDGKAEVWLENDSGVVEKKIMGPGDFFNVTPPKKHRVIALTDIILQEVSTPQVDDVIRIEDDTRRANGKIEGEHERPALCILAAGLGSRMKHLSSDFNKGLLPVNNKAIISNIINNTCSSYEIIIALGHKGQFVKDYCLAAHPDRDFVFVEIDNIDGEGSGPGYSLAQCQKHLQRPFILSTADCYINSNEKFKIDGNWLGIHPTSIPELYSTVKVDENNVVIKFKNKSIDGYRNAFIGVCSILSYEKFWSKLEQVLDQSGELVSVFSDPANLGLKALYFDWYDVGTIDGYIRAKNKFDRRDQQYGIEKINGEQVYKVGNNFVKFSPDKSFIKGRIKRSEALKGLVPKLNYKAKNFYSYEWIEGQTLYDCDDMEMWTDCLDWCSANLWTSCEGDIKDSCWQFYHEKTLQRFRAFKDNRDIDYESIKKINGKNYHTIEYYLDKLDWDDITNGSPTRLFHGDLQFDNIIYNGDSFNLIDWRHTFGTTELVGDIYYDLAKLYGGIKMSYKLMKNKENYSASIESGNAIFNYKTSDNLKRFEKIYLDWLTKKGYNIVKIKKITSLIYLNMSPLHEEELGDVLYFLARQQLNECYDK